MAGAECFPDLIAVVHIRSVSCLWRSIPQVLGFLCELVQLIPSPGVIYISVLCSKPFLEEYTGEHLMTWSRAVRFFVTCFVFSHQFCNALLMPLSTDEDAAQK